MKNIRPKSFETNSSSDHSLVISSDIKLYGRPFTVAETNAGIVDVYPGIYGWCFKKYHTIHNKLAVAYTHAMINFPYHKFNTMEVLNDINNASDALLIGKYKLNNLVKLKRCTLQHSGIKLRFNALVDGDSFDIAECPFGGIDHQSVDIYDKLWVDTSTLAHFIFNANSYFITDNDNN